MICILAGMLYVVGGSDGQTTLNSVEMYDPITGNWSFACNLGVPRANMGAVVKGRMFFLVGGFGGKSFLKSQEYLSDEAEEWCSYLPADANVEGVVGEKLKKSTSSNCLDSSRGKGICLNLDPAVAKLTNGGTCESANIIVGEVANTNFHSNIQPASVPSDSNSSNS